MSASLMTPVDVVRTLGGCCSRTTKYAHAMGP